MRRATTGDWQADADAGSNWVAVATPMRDSIFGGVSKAHSADTTGDNFWGLGAGWASAYGVCGDERWGTLCARM